MLRIIINGALGKMGRMVCEVAALEPDCEIVAGVDRFAAGASASFPLFESLSDTLPEADVLLDFSRPDALDGILEYCLKRNLPAVLSTTGYTADDIQRIADAAMQVPLFQSANMSVGINLLMNLSQEAAKVLKGFDIEIIEAHHNTKVDAPSGTALMLADSVNQGLVEQREYIFGRHTKTERRKPDEIGIHAIRGGTMTGEHTVMYMGQDEFIRLNHQAQSRRIYAVGAIRAAQYLERRPAGLYNMHDLLLEQHSVTALSVDGEQALMTLRDLPGDAASVAGVFEALGKERILVDMISQTAPREGKLDLSFTLPRSDLEAAGKCLGRYQMETSTQVTKITIEGQGMAHQSGVAARLFTNLAERRVRILLITTSETKIGLLVETECADAASDAIRQAFSL